MGTRYLLLIIRVVGTARGFKKKLGQASVWA
jgi:hypothetical protein